MKYAHIRLLFFSAFLFLGGATFSQDFITTWQTDNPGPSDDNQITIPTNGGGYNYDIDWGDGNMDNGVTGDITHTYATPGIYTVSISGSFPSIFFNGAGFPSSNTDHDKILTVEQWGNIPWTSMRKAFSDCANLRINAPDAPDLSSVTDISFMFEDAVVFNDDIGSWNVSNVTTMSGVFEDAIAFNQPLDSWNVSSVTDMSDMFFFASSFDQPLSSWVVDNVVDMSSLFGGATNFNQDIGGWNMAGVLTVNGMFAGCENFNQDLSSWIVDDITDMTSLFNSARAFDQDISGWNVGNVTNMSFMFSDASNFNADISGWNITNVQNMSGLFRRASAFNADITGWDVSGINAMISMFEGNTTFNQDISGWVVTSVSNTEDMFNGATAFNQNISSWIVDNVSDMSGMFQNASAFNQDITGWNVGNVDDMRFMFSGASAFDQNLAGWDVTNLRFAVSMFNNSGLSIENYDNILTGWNSQSVRSNVSLGASGIFYCSAEVARAELIANNGWFISDAGQGCIAAFDGTNPTALEIQNGQIAPLDFGSIDLPPSNKTRVFTILNRIATPVTGINVSITGTAFAVTPAAPTIIPAGNFENFNVVLSGSAPGTFTETLTISSVSFATDFVFTLTGEITIAPEPEIAVYQGASLTGTEIFDDLASTYDFGSEPRGTSITREIAITNKGSTTLDITSMSISGSSFSFVAATPTAIAVDAVEVVQIILDGSTPGVFQETLTIINDDSNESTFNFDIEGEIIGPDIVVWEAASIFAGPQIFDGQTASIDFGSGAQGVDITRQITIGNFNPVDLAVSSISVSGSAFSTTAGTPFVVAAEFDGVVTGVTVDIVLSGANPGVFSETVIIASDDQDEPAFTFPISGQIGSGFPEIAVFNSGGTEVFDGQASPVDFGSQVQGSGINETLSIQNVGTTDLTITDIRITPGTQFGINSAISLPLVIGAGSNQLLDILLTGGTVGIFTETVTIQSDDADESTFNFEITGEITSPPEPEIAVFVGPDISGAQIFDGQIAPIDFGTTTQGANLTQQITIQNQGTADLDLNTYSFSPSGVFLISTTPASTIGPGLSETIDIEFDASTIGISTATFEIDNNDSDETIFNFQVTAEVTPPPLPEIAVFVGPDNTGTEIFNGQPTPVMIGVSEVGTDITQAFTIENSGSAPLTVSDITFSNSAFTPSVTAFVVSGSSSTSFIVTLDAGMASEFGANFTIVNDDSDENPFVFPIQGSIVVPNSVPTISSIADVSIDEDDTTGDLPFTINDAETNLDDLIVTAFSDDLTIVTPGGIVLGGSGGTRTINITPEPDANGLVTITVQVDDTQDTVTETFSITVNAVNDVPVITGQQTITTPQNTPVTLNLTDFTVSDVDNLFPTGFSISLSAGQNYTVNGNNVIPDLDFVGDLTVSVVVNDGSDDSAPFDANITVIEGELEVLIGGEPLVNGQSINFDDIPVGAEDIRSLEVANSGTIPLVISEIVIVGDDFMLLSDVPDPIQPGGSTALQISFQPTTPGVKSALLTIRSTSAADFSTTLTASGLSEIPPLEIFNVVTTQQNDKHDFLEIRNIEFYDSNRVFIYSRWGNEVYKTVDYNNDTNRFAGNSDDGDELPDGTYYYVIELNGGEIVENGFFLLRR